MKKKVVIWMMAIALLLGMAGCKGGDSPEASGNQGPAAVGFADKRWSRDTETCTETICFRSNGSCSYYCACGNPVNDDDLCEGYHYDEQSKTIYLEFIETTEETVTQITVESYDEQTLVLNFNGDLRTFHLEEQ